MFIASLTGAGVLLWREVEAGTLTRDKWKLIGICALYGVLVGNVLWHYPGIMRRLRGRSKPAPELGAEFYEWLDEYRDRMRVEFVERLGNKEAQPPK